MTLIVTSSSPCEGNLDTAMVLADGPRGGKHEILVRFTRRGTVRGGYQFSPVEKYLSSTEIPPEVAYAALKTFQENNAR